MLMELFKPFSVNEKFLKPFSIRNVFRTISSVNVRRAPGTGTFTGGVGRGGKTLISMKLLISTKNFNIEKIF